MLSPENRTKVIDALIMRVERDIEIPLFEVYHNEIVRHTVALVLTHYERVVAECTVQLSLLGSLHAKKDPQ